MSTTSSSLFHRLKQTGEQSAWERLVDIYSPLLYMWACRAGLQGPEASELVRSVFAAFSAQLPNLQEKPPGGFRTLFRSLAHDQRRHILAQRQLPEGGADTIPDDAFPIPNAANTIWTDEYVPFILGRALEFLQAEFSESDWKACWAVAVEGRPRGDVAREMNVTPAAVAIAEASVLRRLRQELDGFLD